MHILSNLGIITVLPLQTGNREEVGTVEILTNLLVSVVANAIGYCVCKWLDRHDRGR